MEMDLHSAANSKSLFVFGDSCLAREASAWIVGWIGSVAASKRSALSSAAKTVNCQSQDSFACGPFERFRGFLEVGTVTAQGLWPGACLLFLMVERWDRGGEESLMQACVPRSATRVSKLLVAWN